MSQSLNRQVLQAVNPISQLSKASRSQDVIVYS